MLVRLDLYIGSKIQTILGKKDFHYISEQNRLQRFLTRSV